MSLKSIIRVQFLFLGAFLLSCGDDDNKKEELSFIDQNLQGELFGEPWEFADGGAYEIGLNTMYTLGLFSTIDEDDCANNDITGHRLSFFFPKEPGSYKLGDATFFQVDISNGDSGSDEVLKADDAILDVLTVSETMITGRLAVRKGDNYINGNFSVPFCAGAD